MIIIFGHRLMGKVDEVPGLFHVATRFGHIYYLPLIPVRSYIVIGKTGNDFRGVPIPLNAKSILMAWARAISLVAAIVMFVMAGHNYFDNRWADAAFQGVLAVAASVVCAYTMGHRSATQASVERAYELGQKLGLNEVGMAAIHRIYGEAAPRGFDVAPAARLVPVPPALPQTELPAPYVAVQYPPAPQPLAGSRVEAPAPTIGLN